MNIRPLIITATIAACLALMATAHATTIDLNQTQAQKAPVKKAPSKTSKPAAVPTGNTYVSSSSNQQQQQQQAQNQSQLAQGGRGGNGYSASSSGSKSASEASSGSDNAGNVQGTQVSDDYHEVRQTPPAVAGTVQPTASCKNAVNGGASSPVFGAAFGIGTKDEECDRRELARSFYEMGERDTAIKLLCMSKLARNLDTCGPTKQPDEYPAGEREKRMQDRGFPGNK